jgi:predicted nucleic acid-binding protein
VLSEACFLLGRHAAGPSAILELVSRRVLIVPFQVEAEVTAVARLVAQYSHAPMSPADACLVRMSEQYADSIVVTFDRQFRVYRRHRREVIPTLMPPAKPGRRR